MCGSSLEEVLARVSSTAVAKCLRDGIRKEKRGSHNNNNNYNNYYDDGFAKIASDTT